MEVGAINYPASVDQTGGLIPLQSNSMLRDDFLALLIAQLQNQNPFSPIDNQDFMAQLAQFSVLQQVEAMNDSMAALITMEQINQASALLGKEVETYPDASGKVVSGLVTDVDLTGERVTVIVDGYRIGLTDIAKIT